MRGALLLSLMGIFEAAALSRPMGDLATGLSPLRQAEIAFENRAQESSAREAHAGFLALAQEQPSSFEIQWRLAMASYFIGHRLTQDEDARSRMFDEGVQAGKRSVELSKAVPCAPCHFWTGINLALYGEVEGAFHMVRLLPEIRKHLERVIEIDPKYAYGGAHRVLGELDSKVPGWLGGDSARAERHFRRAIENAPDEPMNILALLGILKRDPGRAIKESARFIEQARALPPPESKHWIGRPESLDALQVLLKLPKPSEN